MLNDLFRLNASIGIGLQINYDNTLDIEACKIVTDRNRLDFEKKIYGLKSIEELTRHFPKKSIIAVNLNGKGVLHKQIEKTNEITPANFSQILPNANLKDFYIQNFISGSKSFISVIRKEDAEKWLKSFRDQHFIPIMLSLGPFPVQIILPQLNVYGTSLIFNGHLIDRNDEGDWLSYRYDQTATAPFPFKIENENISEKMLIGYATAFQLIFAKQTDTVEANVKTLSTEYNHILSEKRLKIFGIFMIIIPIIILILNGLVYFYLKSENQKLVKRIHQTSFSFADKQVLKQDIENKEATLKKLGWDGGISKAYLLDQLAASLPADITWKELAVNPTTENKGRNPERFAFSERIIRINGSCNRMFPVNEWLVKLKEKDWVKTVQLVSYLYNPEEDSGNFEIVIQY